MTALVFINEIENVISDPFYDAIPIAHLLTLNYIYDCLSSVFIIIQGAPLKKDCFTGGSNSKESGCNAVILFKVTLILRLILIKSLCLVVPTLPLLRVSEAAKSIYENQCFRTCFRYFQNPCTFRSSRNVLLSHFYAIYTQSCENCQGQNVSWLLVGGGNVVEIIIECINMITSQKQTTE